MFDTLIKCVEVPANIARLIPYNEETKKDSYVTWSCVKEEEIIQFIREVEPNVKSIVHNVNNRNTNVIFGDVTNVIWGKAVIEDLIGDVRLEILYRLKN